MTAPTTGYCGCPRCDHNNIIRVIALTGLQVTKAETACSNCGHKDYWTTEGYESESQPPELDKAEQKL